MKITQLTIEEFFPYKQDTIDIGTLTLTWKDFEEKYGIRFDEDCDDLDTYKYAVVELDNGYKYLIWAYQNWQHKDPQKVIIKLQAYVENPIEILKQFIKILNLSEDTIEWENEYYQGRPRYRIMRQDDNGNIFVVANFFEREHAQSISEHLESKGHKQTYWVEKFQES